MVRLLFTIFFLSIISTLLGQEEIKFESLKVNSAPAYVILGVAPENIQRPSSPTQFIAGIQNAVVNGKLKPNTAFEFTPYYWAKPKNTDSVKFHPAEYILARGNILQNIGKTFSLSFATSESDTVVYGKLKPGMAIGTGIKFTIVEGQPKKGVILHLKQWNEAKIKYHFYKDVMLKLGGVLNPADENVKTYASLILELLKEYQDISLRNIDFNGTSYTYSYNLVNQIANEILTAVRVNRLVKKADLIQYLEIPRDINFQLMKSELQAVNAYGKIPFTKQGFMIEAAAGQAIVFQNSGFRDVAFAKTAIWITPSYRWQIESEKDIIKLVDLISVFRYTINNKKDTVDVADYLDAGLKFQYTKNVFSISLEGIYRHASELPKGLKKPYTWRWVSSFDYKFSNQLTFKFSFGTNFNGNTSTYTKPKDMFAIGGLNLGLFNPKKDK